MDATRQPVHRYVVAARGSWDHPQDDPGGRARRGRTLSGRFTRLPAAPPSQVSLARSTLLVMAATLSSSILGFGREVINARFYGTFWEMDAFLAAATIP